MVDYINKFYENHKHNNIMYYVPPIKKLNDYDKDFIREYVRLENKKYSRSTENEIKESMIKDYLENKAQMKTTDDELFTVQMRCIDLLDNYKDCFNEKLYKKNYFDDDSREY